MDERHSGKPHSERRTVRDDHSLDDASVADLNELRKLRDEAFKLCFDTKNGLPHLKALECICQPSVVRNELTFDQKRILVAWKKLAGDEIDIKPILGRFGPQEEGTAWRNIQLWAEEAWLGEPFQGAYTREENLRIAERGAEEAEREDEICCYYDSIDTPNEIPNPDAVNKVRDFIARKRDLNGTDKMLLFSWHRLSKVDIDPILKDHRSDSAADAWNELRLWADKEHFGQPEAGELQDTGEGNAGNDEPASDQVETEVVRADEARPTLAARYLGLTVCDKSKTIARESVTVKIDLSKKDIRWSIFMPLFKAESYGISPKALKEKHSGTPGSFNSNLSNLRGELGVLGVTVSNARSSRYKLIDNR
jgi:hypothetical protein